MQRVPRSEPLLTLGVRVGGEAGHLGAYEFSGPAIGTALRVLDRGYATPSAENPLQKARHCEGHFAGGGPVGTPSRLTRYIASPQTTRPLCIRQRRPGTVD